MSDPDVETTVNQVQNEKNVHNGLFIENLQSASTSSVNHGIFNEEPCSKDKSNKRPGGPINDVILEKKKKKENIEPPKLIEPNRDIFCWKCHKFGNDMMKCNSCPRVYHFKCTQLEEKPNDWTCFQCLDIQNYKTDNRINAHHLKSSDYCKLLEFALKRMWQHEGCSYFENPVDLEQYPEYLTYIVNPKCISEIEEKVTRCEYSCCEAFLADIRWLVHNSYIFNGAHSDLTLFARTLLKMAKQECEEMANCPDCYQHANTLDDDKWFIELCEDPHILVWAKLKGFPYWPGKVINSSPSTAEVRFFGDHNKAAVPIDACFLYSKQPPKKQKRDSNLESAMEEAMKHIQKLQDRFGEFHYSPPGIEYKNGDKDQQLKIFLPGFDMMDSIPGTPAPRIFKMKRISADVEYPLANKARFICSSNSIDNDQNRTLIQNQPSNQQTLNKHNLPRTCYYESCARLKVLSDFKGDNTFSRKRLMDKPMVTLKNVKKPLITLENLNLDPNESYIVRESSSNSISYLKGKNYIIDVKVKESIDNQFGKCNENHNQFLNSTDVLGKDNCKNKKMFPGATDNTPVTAILNNHEESVNNLPVNMKNIANISHTSDISKETKIGLLQSSLLGCSVTNKEEDENNPGSCIIPSSTIIPQRCLTNKPDLNNDFNLRAPKSISVVSKGSQKLSDCPSQVLTIFKENVSKETLANVKNKDPITLESNALEGASNSLDQQISENKSINNISIRENCLNDCRTSNSKTHEIEVNSCNSNEIIVCNSEIVPGHSQLMENRKVIDQIISDSENCCDDTIEQNKITLKNKHPINTSLKDFINTETNMILDKDSSGENSLSSQKNQVKLSNGVINCKVVTLNTARRELPKDKVQLIRFYKSPIKKTSTSDRMCSVIERKKNILAFFNSLKTREDISTELKQKILKNIYTKIFKSRVSNFEPVGHHAPGNGSNKNNNNIETQNKPEVVANLKHSSLEIVKDISKLLPSDEEILANEYQFRNENNKKNNKGYVEMDKNKTRIINIIKKDNLPLLKENQMNNVRHDKIKLDNSISNNRSISTRILNGNNDNSEKMSKETVEILKITPLTSENNVDARVNNIIQNEIQSDNSVRLNIENIISDVNTLLDYGTPVRVVNKNENNNVFANRACFQKAINSGKTASGASSSIGIQKKADDEVEDTKHTYQQDEKNAKCIQDSTVNETLSTKNDIQISYTQSPREKDFFSKVGTEVIKTSHSTIHKKELEDNNQKSQDSSCTASHMIGGIASSVKSVPSFCRSDMVFQKRIINFLNCLNSNKPFADAAEEYLMKTVNEERINNPAIPEAVVSEKQQITIDFNNKIIREDNIPIHEDLTDDFVKSDVEVRTLGNSSSSDKSKKFTLAGVSSIKEDKIANRIFESPLTKRKGPFIDDISSSETTNINLILNDKKEKHNEEPSELMELTSLEALKKKDNFLTPSVDENNIMNKSNAESILEESNEEPLALMELTSLEALKKKDNFLTPSVDDNNILNKSNAESKLEESNEEPLELMELTSLEALKKKDNFLTPSVDENNIMNKSNTESILEKSISSDTNIIAHRIGSSTSVVEESSLSSKSDLAFGKKRHISSFVSSLQTNKILANTVRALIVKNIYSKTDENGSISSKAKALPTHGKKDVSINISLRGKLTSKADAQICEQMDKNCENIAPLGWCSTEVIKETSTLCPCGETNEKSLEFSANVAPRLALSKSNESIPIEDPKIIVKSHQPDNIVERNSAGEATVINEEAISNVPLQIELTGNQTLGHACNSRSIQKVTLDSDLQIKSQIAEFLNSVQRNQTLAKSVKTKIINNLYSPKTSIFNHDFKSDFQNNVEIHKGTSAVTDNKDLLSECGSMGSKDVSVLGPNNEKIICINPSLKTDSINEIIMDEPPVANLEQGLDDMHSRVRKISELNNDKYTFDETSKIEKIGGVKSDRMPQIMIKQQQSSGVPALYNNNLCRDRKFSECTKHSGFEKTKTNTEDTALKMDCQNEADLPKSSTEDLIVNKSTSCQTEDLDESAGLSNQIITTLPAVVMEQVRAAKQDSSDVKKLEDFIKQNNLKDNIAHIVRAQFLAIREGLLRKEKKSSCSKTTDTLKFSTSGDSFSANISVKNKQLLENMSYSSQSPFVASEELSEMTNSESNLINETQKLINFQESDQNIEGPSSMNQFSDTLRISQNDFIIKTKELIRSRMIHKHKLQKVKNSISLIKALKDLNKDTILHRNLEKAINDSRFLLNEKSEICVLNLHPKGKPGNEAIVIQLGNWVKPIAPEVLPLIDLTSSEYYPPKHNKLTSNEKSISLNNDDAKEVICTSLKNNNSLFAPYKIVDGEFRVSSNQKKATKKEVDHKNSCDHKSIYENSCSGINSEPIVFSKIELPTSLKGNDSEGAPFTKIDDSKLKINSNKSKTIVEDFKNSCDSIVISKTQIKENESPTLQTDDVLGALTTSSLNSSPISKKKIIDVKLKHNSSKDCKHSTDNNMISEINFEQSEITKSEHMGDKESKKERTHFNFWKNNLIKNVGMKKKDEIIELDCEEEEESSSGRSNLEQGCNSNDSKVIMHVDQGKSLTELEEELYGGDITETECDSLSEEENLTEKSQIQSPNGKIASHKVIENEANIEQCKEKPTDIGSKEEEDSCSEGGYNSEWGDNVDDEASEDNLDDEGSEHNVDNEDSEDNLDDGGSEHNVDDEASEDNLDFKGLEHNVDNEDSEYNLDDEGLQHNVDEEAAEDNSDNDGSEHNADDEDSEDNFDDEDSEHNVDDEDSEDNLDDEDSEDNLDDEGSEHNLDDETSEDNLDNDGPDHNVDDEASDDNIDDKGSEHNIGDEASGDNLDDEGLDYEVNDEASEDNLDDKGTEHNIDDEASEDNLDDEGSVHNIDEEVSEANLDDEGPDYDVNDEASEGNLDDKSSEHNIDEVSEDNLDDEGSVYTIDDEASEDNLVDEGSEHNVDDEALEVYLDNDGPDHNVDDEASDDNIDDKGSEHNIGDEASGDNLDDEGLDYDVNDEASEDNLDDKGSEHNIDDEASEDNLDDEGSVHNTDEEVSEYNLDDEGPDYDVHDEASEGNLDDKSSEHNIDEASEDNLDDEGSVYTIDDEASEDNLVYEGLEHNVDDEVLEGNLDDEGSEDNLDEGSDEECFSSNSLSEKTNILLEKMKKLTISSEKEVIQVPLDKSAEIAGTAGLHDEQVTRKAYSFLEIESLSNEHMSILDSEEDSFADWENLLSIKERFPTPLKLQGEALKRQLAGINGMTEIDHNYTPIIRSPHKKMHNKIGFRSFTSTHDLKIIKLFISKLKESLSYDSDFLTIADLNSDQYDLLIERINEYLQKESRSSEEKSPMLNISNLKLKDQINLRVIHHIKNLYFTKYRGSRNQLLSFLFELLKDLPCLVKELGKHSNDDYVDEVMDKCSAVSYTVSKNYQPELNLLKATRFCIYCKDPANLHCCFMASYCSPECKANHLEGHKETCLDISGQLEDRATVHRPEILDFIKENKDMTVKEFIEIIETVRLRRLFGDDEDIIKQLTETLNKQTMQQQNEIIEISSDSETSNEISTDSESSFNEESQTCSENETDKYNELPLEVILDTNSGENLAECNSKCIQITSKMDWKILSSKQSIAKGYMSSQTSGKQVRSYSSDNNTFNGISNRKNVGDNCNSNASKPSQVVYWVMNKSRNSTNHIYPTSSKTNLETDSSMSENLDNNIYPSSSNEKVTYSSKSNRAINHFLSKPHKKTGSCMEDKGNSKTNRFPTCSKTPSASDINNRSENNINHASSKVVTYSHKNNGTVNQTFSNPHKRTDDSLDGRGNSETNVFPACSNTPSVSNFGYRSNSENNINLVSSNEEGNSETNIVPTWSNSFSVSNINYIGNTECNVSSVSSNVEASYSHKNNRAVYQTLSTPHKENDYFTGVIRNSALTTFSKMPSGSSIRENTEKNIYPTFSKTPQRIYLHESDEEYANMFMCTPTARTTNCGMSDGKFVENIISSDSSNNKTDENIEQDKTPGKFFIKVRDVESINNSISITCDKAVSHNESESVTDKIDSNDLTLQNNVIKNPIVHESDISKAIEVSNNTNNINLELIINNKKSFHINQMAGNLMNLKPGIKKLVPNKDISPPSRAPFPPMQSTSAKNSPGNSEVAATGRIKLQAPNKIPIRQGKVTKNVLPQRNTLICATKNSPNTFPKHVDMKKQSSPPLNSSLTSFKPSSSVPNNSKKPEYFLISEKNASGTNIYKLVDHEYLKNSKTPFLHVPLIS